MIERTFAKIDEIDDQLHEKLYSSGISTWNELLKAVEIKGITQEEKAALDVKIKENISALEKKNFRYFTQMPPGEHWRIYDRARKLGKVLYMDIESTGRQIFRDEITVAGFYDGKEYRALVSGKDLTCENLASEFAGYDMIVTHRGMVFDIPFLEYKFPDVDYQLLHFDLSFAGRKLDLPESFSELMTSLEIDQDSRNKKFESVTAVKLWEEYKKGGVAALDLILEKNKSEVMLMEKAAAKIFEMLRENELNGDEEGEERVMEEEKTSAKDDGASIGEQEGENETTSVKIPPGQHKIDKTPITSPDAPEAIGPYSPGIKCNGMLFISGQLPMEPDTGRLVGGGFGIKTKKAMDNLGAILHAAGMDFNNLVKVTIYTTQLDKFHQINEAYTGYFTDCPPARAVIGVSELPKGAEIEIEAVAMY